MFVADKEVKRISKYDKLRLYEPRARRYVCSFSCLASCSYRGEAQTHPFS